jgi:hydroxymethylbilane synthase
LILRIGSRGSQLALWQANFIADALRGLGLEVAIQVIRTAGDRMQQAAFPAAEGKGIFTKEIEDALLAGSIDLAVHSLKDLPTEISPAFTLAAIPKRADPRDVLVSQRYRSIDELPAGAVVGTGSLRRQAQLRSLRPDFKTIEFRGNVDTRLAKLAGGEADAIVLAAAGLDRLQKMDWIRQRFAPGVLCPAAGQGALAIECRADDEATRSALRPLEDGDTRLAITAEREFLAALGGGCQTPIGVYCSRADNTGQSAEELVLLGVVASADGSRILRGEMRHSDAKQLGQRLAHELLEQGAETILGLQAPRI